MTWAKHFFVGHHGNKWIVLLTALVIGTAGGPAFASGPFAKWAAVVVSGDWHAHDGRPSEIFDNSRRDVTHDLETLGFARDNIGEISARPGSRPMATASAIRNVLSEIFRRTGSGCLMYFSSHGSPGGILIGNSILEPRALARILDSTCDGRPAVVVVSSCFSGVFVPALKARNRIIITAARRDRTSFGCGQTDLYPYFDQCVLSVWPQASNFAMLGRRAQICVAAREKRERMAPPSQPQLWVGADAENIIPKWR